MRFTDVALINTESHKDSVIFLCKSLSILVIILRKSWFGINLSLNFLNPPFNKAELTFDKMFSSSKILAKICYQVLLFLLYCINSYCYFLIMADNSGFSICDSDINFLLCINILSKQQWINFRKNMIVLVILR